jgi:hypothetical protein
MTTPSENPYDWTPTELEAALKAYNDAPDDTTVGELRALMLAAKTQVHEEN